MKLLFPAISLLIICLPACKEKTYAEPDLTFFNVKGNVKTYSEIAISMTFDTNSDFDYFDKMRPNYHKNHFSKEGKLVEIENMHPSDYAKNGFNINIKRRKNALTITQHSLKEKFVRTYTKAGDTLKVSRYNKIVDDNLHYDYEMYKEEVFVRDSTYYLDNGYNEGQNESNIAFPYQYSVVKNQDGLDSLIYEVQKGKEPLLLYTVTYRMFDAKGNWLVKYYIKNPILQWPYLSRAIYRKIEYYN